MSFRLQFRSGHKQHVIGRFRLSITTIRPALLRPIPEGVQRAARHPSRRSARDAQKKAVTDIYLASEAALDRGEERRPTRQERPREGRARSPRTMVMRERAKPRETFILVKGAYDKYARQGRARHARGAARRCRRCAAEPSRARPLARLAGEIR